MIPCYKLSAEAETYYDEEIKNRLGLDGRPLKPGNDYERHLYARHLRQHGKSREQIRLSLIELGLDDIPRNKRDSYVNDILDSVLVGLSSDPLPIFV